MVPLEKTLVSKYYSKEGKKVGEAGEVDLDTSYVHLLSQCKDFKNEQSQLEKIGAKYGYEIWFTPKYHCELAGEGIEYMWGYMKWIYRRIKKEKKSTKKIFEDCVKQLVHGNTVSAERIRQFSRRARRYVCAYYVTHFGVDKGNAMENVVICLELVESMVKDFKTHHCALDFDKKLIKQEAERH